MKVLGIETSSIIGGVAVCKNRNIIITRDFGTDMQHGKELVPTIKSVFKEIGWILSDIDLISVDVGPGSYTGLRIGVTCAKVLAYALKKPVIGVSIFDIIAENYTMNSTPICPIIDARRNHVYACIYNPNLTSNEQAGKSTKRKKQSEFLVIKPAELLSLLPRPVIIFGDGVTNYKNIFQQKDIFIDKEEMAMPKPEYVALLGEMLYSSGQRCKMEELTPLYLRQAEAIEKFEKEKG